MAKEIRFNAFEMNCVAHQSPGLWRHPRDRSRDYRCQPASNFAPRSASKIDPWW
jgi:hypothetical protein